MRWAGPRDNFETLDPEESESLSWGQRTHLQHRIKGPGTESCQDPGCEHLGHVESLRTIDLTQHCGARGHFSKSTACAASNPSGYKRKGSKAAWAFPTCCPACTSLPAQALRWPTRGSLITAIMVLPDSSKKAWTYWLGGGMGFADGGVCILSLTWWPLREGLSKHWQSQGRADSEMSRATVSCCSSLIQFEGLPFALAILPLTATRYADRELGEKSSKQTFLFLRNLAITKIHLKCDASGDVLDVASFICWTPAIKSVIVATQTVSVAGSQCQPRCIVCNEQQGLWLDLG